jgi:hypothetical protein
VVVANFRGGLAVNKQATQKFDMECFNLKKLNEVEGKEHYRDKISNMFAALEILHNEVDINRARKTIGDNIKMSAK